MKQNKLYSWLTSLLVMVMLALVGQTAMAQDATFDFVANKYVGELTSGDVQVNYKNYEQGANIWGPHDDVYKIVFTGLNGAKITKIEFEVYQQGYNYGELVASIGSLSYNYSGTSVWTGEAESVLIDGTDYDTDVYITTARVWVSSSVSEPITYTVVVNDAPVGATVTLDDQNMTAGGQITVEKNLSLSNLSVTEPTGYYAEKEYDTTTHTFTVTFKEYLQYPVVVTGTTDANAGVVYDGVTYHAGESVLAKTAITAADVTAAEVSGLEGTVTLDAGTFTVTYKAPSYYEFTTSGSGFGQRYYFSEGPVSGSYAAYYGQNNIYGTDWYTEVQSSGAPIAKIEFLGISGFSYVQASVGTLNTSTGVWTGDGSATYVKFTGGDGYSTGLRVYLKELTPETYTVSISGNPSEAKLKYDGNEYANGSSFTAALTKDDLSATTIEGYSYSITIEGTTIKVVYAEKFPKEGVAYKLLESGGLYLNVFKNTNNRAKDVVLLSTPQALYFTETTGGFYIQDANGYYVGGYTNNWNMNCETPEVWTVEPVTGGYALKCVTTGSYLGFNDNTTGGETSAGYRDKTSSACGIFSILTFEKGTFGLAASQKTDITGEEISRYPNINLAEDYTMALGLTDQQVYIQDAMKFYKVVEGVDVEISSPIGDICVYPSSYGMSTVWLNGSQNCETPGVYKFVFPKGLFENAANENGEITITYTVEKQLYSNYSNAVQENDFVLNGFDVVFNHDVTSVDVTDAALYCGTDEVSTTIGYSIEGATVHFTFTPAIEKAGSYKLSLPAGAVVSDGVATTAVVETSPATVKNRLVVTSAGWTTFCPSENVKLPAGYTPYILTKAEDGQATIQEILGSYPTANEYFWIYSDGSVVENDGVLISKAYGSSEAVGIKLDANATFTDGDCLQLLGNGQVTVSCDNTIKSIYISGYGNCIINGELYTPYTNVDLNTKSFTITTDGGETMTIDYLYVSYEDQTQGRNDVVIPAGEGILVQGAENAAVAYETTWETPSDVTGNLLYGCTADEEYTDYADCYFYKFSLNKNNEAGSEGFYWGSADGHSISMHAGKAYLILDADDAAGIRGFRLFGEETEGISMKTTEDNGQPIFNLQGQRMGGKLSTGIYVKNGKKVLVK